jgi:nitric oxide dioxygenase
LLAAILSQREATLYAAEAAAPDGWRGFKPFRLERRTAESEDISSFVLVPEDGRPVPPFTPGQYITVKARHPGSPYDQIRQYSISHAPNGRSYRIAVRREASPAGNIAAGLMSSILHDSLREGDTLLVHMPLGDLLLDQSERPVVLLSGGSGITPVLAMLDWLTSPRGGARPVVFVHAARSRQALAFGHEVAAFAARRSGVSVVTLLDADDGGDGAPGVRRRGRISPELLRQEIPDDAEIYLCGPPGFMAAVETALDMLMVPAPRRHSESFGPDASFGDGIDPPLPRAASVR